MTSGTTTHDFLRSVDLFVSLEDDALRAVAEHLHPVSLAAGERLFAQGEQADALYIVRAGLLRVAARQNDGSEALVAEVGPGTVVGEMQVLTGGERSSSIDAARPSELLRLDAGHFADLLGRYPEIETRMLELVRRRLRRNELAAIVRGILGELNEEVLQLLEQEAEWRLLGRGEQLIRQGDPSDSIFVVISGRLQAYDETDPERPRALGEIRRGEAIGELGLLTGEPRTSSVYAIRESELAELPRRFLDPIMEERPEVLRGLTRVVIERLRRANRPQSRRAAIDTIAVVPVSRDLHLESFVLRLVGALSAHGNVLHLNSSFVDRALGTPGVSQMERGDPRHSRMAAWLDEQEAQHRFTVYEADLSATPWSERSIGRADRVLLVADARASTEPGEIEKRIDVDRSSLRQTLVLMHEPSTHLPSGTAAWLERRRVHDHHHLRWEAEPDFARLARFLAGRAIGLVLGGGGARGLAHLGVLRAMREMGIPCDMIGGTSMGSIVAAQPAIGWDDTTMLSKTREALITGDPLGDYTVPTLSVVRSRNLDACLHSAFGDTRIEDLWLGFFCISSNLTQNDIAVHREGLLWRAVRASAAIPGVILPVLEGTDLLVDGGVLNNVPGDVMRELCGGHVIAVDVSGESSLVIRRAEMPSHWDILWDRLLPFRARRNEFPTILDTLMYTTMLASTRHRLRIRDDVDLSIRPKVDRFRILDFQCMDEIVHAGYESARPELERWWNEHGG